MTSRRTVDRSTPSARHGMYTVDCRPVPDPEPAGDYWGTQSAVPRPNLCRFDVEHLPWVSPMSSRCRLASGLVGLVVGVQVAEDDAGQAAFEAAQGFGTGVTVSESFAVVGLSESV